MFASRKKNDLKVEPIKLKSTIPPHKILGYDMFSELYANIFLCAKKKSGKTNTLFYILRNCAGIYKVDEAGVHRSKLWIFSSTVYKDDNWQVILDWADERGFEYEIYEDIAELDAVSQLLSSDGTEPSEKEKEENPLAAYLEPVKTKPKKYKQPDKIAPENIFLFDDMSSTLRNKAMSTFLKKNRHFKSKMLISSQYPNDLDVQGRMQLNYWLLFKGHSAKKLEEILKGTDLDMPFETFKSLYDKATSEPYSFLYIDVNGPEFRQGFDTELIVE